MTLGKMPLALVREHCSKLYGCTQGVHVRRGRYGEIQKEKWKEHEQKVSSDNRRRC